MASEDLTREGYLNSGDLRGTLYGDFEVLNLGATPVSELITAGVTALVPTVIDYPFRRYRPPQRPSSSKPDRVYLRRQGSRLVPVALRQWKHTYLGYFTTERSSNGGTEAINGVIELHRRIARGYRNRENHRLRMLLVAGSLDLTPLPEVR